MNNEEKRIFKWTIVLIAAIVISVITAILVFVYCDGKEQKSNTPKQTVAVDSDGNVITDGQAMPMSMSFVRTSAASDVASVTITASITPSDGSLFSLPH